MIKEIAKKETKNLRREKSFWLVSGILFLLLIASLFISYTNVQKLNSERAEAQKMSREGWLMQPAKNPHSAAHYGNFAFRIKSPLSLFDNGLDTYTGTYLFLEPHKQNGEKSSQAQESTSLLRFGELTPAFVLQTILPLLIIFVCFASVSREKEDNTIKLLLTQGASMRKIVLGKILGNGLAFSALVIPFFVICFISLSVMQQSQTFELSRFLLLFLYYIIYLFIWVSISVLVSAWSDLGRNSLMKLLGIWMLAIIIVPKVSTNIGSLLYQMPSQFEFTELVNKDVKEGLDGHNPSDKRRDALMEKTLKKYGVDHVEDLPVNFDAIAMIESENYTTDVFRKRKDEIDDVFKKQNRISEWATFLNPAQAMQYSSMALSGTDYSHYANFQSQAEDYRLYFVNTMNEFMSTHTKSGDWDSKFGKEAYELVKPSVYQPQPLAFAIAHQQLAFFALLFWVIICGVLISFTNKIRLQ